MKLPLLPIAVLCLAAAPLGAETQLASVITDHAVLQRDVPIHIWGEDSPATRITLTFHGQSIASTANSLGLWEA
jgi:sialate O-acetylesterase